MHRKKILSETHEMYLKTLYDARDKHDVARVSDLAQRLGVSPAAVTGVVKKLERLKLVDHERYGAIALTTRGHHVAECVNRRFETLQAFLVEILAVDPETAAVDACMMEHAVSPQTINRLDALLRHVRKGTVRLPRRLDSRRSCVECEAHEVCLAAEVEPS